MEKTNNNFDDIVLEHLLSEGYAETEKEAKNIMKSMSEGWKSDVIKGAIKGSAKFAGKATRYAGKKLANSKFGNRAKKFIKYTTLGALMF